MGRRPLQSLSACTRVHFMFYLTILNLHSFGTICTWQIIALKISRLGHVCSVEVPYSEEKGLGISKLRKCLCNAKAVECQRQLRYNAAQGGDIGFAQRLCYEKGLGHCLGKCLVGRRLGKKTLILLL